MIDIGHTECIGLAMAIRMPHTISPVTEAAVTGNAQCTAPSPFLAASMIVAPYMLTPVRPKRPVRERGNHQAAHTTLYSLATKA